MNAIIERFERFALRGINRIAYGGKVVPNDLPLMTGEELNEHIYNGLMGSHPIMVARFGNIEFETALYPYICSLPLWKRYLLYAQKKIDYLRYSESFAKGLMNPFCNNAGFFPNDVSLMVDYKRQLFDKDVPYCDYLCCWLMEDIVKSFFPSQMQYAALEAMEPYDYIHPWSRALANMNVLVIHPFSDTIEKQYKKRKKLWDNPDVLPDFNLITIKAVQSIAGEKVPFKDWFEALHHMESQMDSIDYDVAIIGCGAYGFSLAAHAKRMGKKAIHLGGATQILFGIKGKRWDDLPAVNKFYNDDWVYPSKEETPLHKNKVENGCYW